MRFSSPPILLSILSFLRFTAVRISDVSERRDRSLACIPPGWKDQHGHLGVLDVDG